MKKNKFLFVLLLLISISLVCFCSTFFYVKNKEEAVKGDLLVMTSCNPVYLATINVVGNIDGLTVTNLSQPTTGCLHDYTLTTEDMKNLSEADVLIVNGGGMEGYLDDVVAAYPDLPIIDTFEYIGIDTDNSHIWMSETLYAKQVEAISEGLSEMYSAKADSFKDNADSFISYLNDNIDKQGLDEALDGANVAVLHEAFEYTAQSLGANVVAVMDLDEERQVSAGEVKEFIDAINAYDVGIVFAEYDYGKAMGDLIMEQTNAKVVYLETLVHGEYSGTDYVDVMNSNYRLIFNKL